MAISEPVSAAEVGQNDASGALLYLQGELDLDTLPYLRAMLNRAIDLPDPTVVHVDLSRVTFMDCSALTPLVSARAHLGDRLKLDHVPKVVSRLFALTGLSDLLLGRASNDPNGPLPKVSAALNTEGTHVTDSSTSATGLFSMFAQMSGFLLSEETIQSALKLVTSLAAETLPGAVGAGVTLVRRGEQSTAAASDAVVEQADALQYSLDEGPCLSAWRQGMMFRVDDTRTETRWPRWTAAVEALGMRAVLSTPMHVHGETMGAIKVYSDEAGVYDERDERILALFAAQASILLSNMQSYENAIRLSDDLKAAVRRRDMIGMAKGVLMTSHGIDEAAAFTSLAQTAQLSQRPLFDVAQDMFPAITERV